MCIGDKVSKYNNTPGRFRHKGPWNSSSHGVRGNYNYYRQLVNCIDNYRCKKFRRKLFEY